MDTDTRRFRYILVLTCDHGMIGLFRQILVTEYNLTFWLVPSIHLVFTLPHVFMPNGVLLIFIPNGVSLLDFIMDLF